MSNTHGPEYSATVLNDAGDRASWIKHHHLCFQPEYENWSPEELRWANWLWEEEHVQEQMRSLDLKKIESVSMQNSSVVSTNALVGQHFAPAFADREGSPPTVSMSGSNYSTANDFQTASPTPAPVLERPLMKDRLSRPRSPPGHTIASEATIKLQYALDEFRQEVLTVAESKVEEKEATIVELVRKNNVLKEEWKNEYKRSETFAKAEFQRGVLVGKGENIHEMAEMLKEQYRRGKQEGREEAFATIDSQQARILLSSNPVLSEIVNSRVDDAVLERNALLEIFTEAQSPPILAPKASSAGIFTLLSDDLVIRVLKTHQKLKSIFEKNIHKLVEKEKKVLEEAFSKRSNDQDLRIVKLQKELQVLNLLEAERANRVKLPYSLEAPPMFKDTQQRDSTDELQNMGAPCPSRREARGARQILESPATSKESSQSCVKNLDVVPPAPVPASRTTSGLLISTSNSSTSSKMSMDHGRLPPKLTCHSCGAPNHGGTDCTLHKDKARVLPTSASKDQNRGQRTFPRESTASSQVQHRDENHVLTGPRIPKGDLAGRFTTSENSKRLRSDSWSRFGVNDPKRRRYDDKVKATI